jgi:hypothetical protein
MAATTTQENEADHVLYWFEKGVTELQIMRNGGPNSKSTGYNHTMQELGLKNIGTVTYLKLRRLY